VLCARRTSWLTANKKRENFSLILTKLILRVAHANYVARSLSLAPRSSRFVSTFLEILIQLYG
jgi:hypothetical protein